VICSTFFMYPVYFQTSTNLNSFVTIQTYQASIVVLTVRGTTDKSQNSHLLTGIIALQSPGYVQIQVRDEQGNPRVLVVADGQKTLHR
jgi:hypothetical protein